MPDGVEVPPAGLGPEAVAGYRTKSQIVYQSLKSAIISGLLPPGERINVKAVSEQMGVSQTPVREALRLLVQEGLVALTPHTDARVADLPVEGLEENLLIRAELEALATRVAAQHITPEVLDELEALFAEMEQCVARREIHRYGELNRWFHLTIYRCIPYRRLYGLIEELWNQVPRARSVFVLVPNYVERSQEGHRRILEALRRGDGETAAQIVREQKLEARKALTTRGSQGTPV